MVLRLDRRVTITRRRTGRTPMGAPVTGFEDGRTLACGFEQLSATEKSQIGRTTSERMARFVLRFSSYSAAIRPDDRLSFGGQPWLIVGTDVLGRRLWVELIALREDKKEE